MQQIVRCIAFALPVRKHAVIVTVALTCVDHTSLVCHHGVIAHHALLLLLHDSIWACCPYRVL